MIELRDVSVRLGSTQALNGVSLAVEPGEWLALIGPNGAGKTTALRALCGLVDYSGEVTIDGRNARSLSRREIARLAALVPQIPETPPGLTVTEYVLLGRTPHLGYFGNEAVGDRVAVERALDRLEREQPGLRVVRMRPGLIFKAQAATEIRRLFAGPLLPRSLVRPGLIPFVPDAPRLRFQAVHSRDVGEAYRLALLSDARGAFNLAAEPPIGVAELAQILHARPVNEQTILDRAH